MTDKSFELSNLVIALFKGVVERDVAPALWQALLLQQSRVRDHVGVLGLELNLDEAEGHAFLRQRQDRADDDNELPRLVARRQLSYPVSLILALLRKKLAEFDATGGDTRLVLSSADILEMVRLFLPDTTNQARFQERVDRDIARIVELGFLRVLKGQSDSYEVRRIIRSFVDAQWLSLLNERLAAYADYGRDAPPDSAAAAHD